jgi:hypothetical protein
MIGFYSSSFYNIPPLLVPSRTTNKIYTVFLNIMLIILKKSTRYTKTGLVFGFSKNQILVAVIPGQKAPRTLLGQNCFWIIAENHFEMSIHSTKTKENEVSGVF